MVEKKTAVKRAAGRGLREEVRSLNWIGQGGRFKLARAALIGPGWPRQARLPPRAQAGYCLSTFAGGSRAESGPDFAQERRKHGKEGRKSRATSGPERSV